jgi:hypothetical protein
MTSEGNATVTTKSNSIPSPPRPLQTVESATLNSQVYRLPPIQTAELVHTPSLPPLKRSSSGRSRDSRAWEFWCDKDARGELEDKAEKDASGSAADAIGLLRSNSGRRILGALPAKGNVLQSRQSFSSKRYKHDSAARGFSRSNTSFGRLQHESTRAAIDTNVVKIASNTIHIPGNDSDKENWSPDSEAHGPIVNSVPTGSKLLKPSKDALRDCDTFANKDKSARERIQRRLSIGENVSPEDDPEIAAFMKGGRRGSSVSGEEEMDCVQGLLSLSQGNWR